jgi:hypothetical protein
MNLKTLSLFGNLSFALGIACFYFIYSRYSILPISTMKILFYLFGGLGIFLNLLQVKEEGLENFNLLHWIGTLLVFIGLIGKISHFSELIWLTYGGLIVIGVSYFYNPFNKKNSNSDILDD